MERNRSVGLDVDLDRAAVLAAVRAAAPVPGVARDGPTMPGPTWREAAASWPARLLGDRTLAVDADSVGPVIEDPCTGGPLQVALFRGGWADVDALLVHGGREAEAAVLSRERHRRRRRLRRPPERLGG